jgi:hypothetical protein
MEGSPTVAATVSGEPQHCHVDAAVLCNPFPGNTVSIMVVVSGLDVTTAWIVSAWELRFNHVILSPWSRSFPEPPDQVGVLGSQHVGASEYDGRRCAQMPSDTESALFHLYQWAVVSDRLKVNIAFAVTSVGTWQR